MSDRVMFCEGVQGMSGRISGFKGMKYEDPVWGAYWVMSRNRLISGDFN